MDNATKPPKTRMRVYRVEHGLTQTKLAAQLGVVVNTVSEIERGARPPTGSQAAAIERLTGIPAADWWPV